MTTAASTANPFRLLRSYLFWTYDRGSIHYDVMVSLILAFLFLGPRFIDFGDKPVATVPLRSTEVLVKEDGSTGTHSRFLYEIRADQRRASPTPTRPSSSAAPPSSASSNPSPARSPSTTTKRSATPRKDHRLRRLDPPLAPYSLRELSAQKKNCHPEQSLSQRHRERRSRRTWGSFPAAIILRGALNPLP